MPMQTSLGRRLTPAPGNLLSTIPLSQVILGHLKQGVARRRVGLLSSGPPARGHTPVLDTQVDTTNIWNEKY